MLSCLEIVRRIPDRRIVCRGSWGGQPVYAKLFIGKEAGRYAKRDLRGIEALVNAGIATPDLLYAGEIANNGGEVLVFTAVADSQNAEQAMSNLPTREARFLLAKSLVIEVACHHQAGLIQTDLYLKNFLLQGAKIYTLDGDAIRTMRPFFRRCQALGNLALLLSKFDVVDEMAWLSELLQAYAEERGWDSPINPASMHKRVAARRRKVVRGYADKKVFRQCSDVQIEKSMDSFVAISRQNFSESLRQALHDPEAVLSQPTTQNLKSGNTCTVGLAEIGILADAGGRKMVVKRYNIKSPSHALSRMFRPSRASISWSNAHRLQMYGIATAAPLGIRERRFGPLRFEAYFFADFIEAPNIGHWLDDENIDWQQKELLAANVANLMYKLRLLQIAHGDFKGTNIMVVGTRPVLMDLDSLHEYRCKTIFEYRHISDLRRLVLNWQVKPELYALMVNALKMVYGDDPLLARAGL